MGIEAKTSNKAFGSMPKGVPFLVLGMACALSGAFFDGFGGGMLIGAGIALIAKGAYMVGATAWPRRQGKGDRGSDWLPSRDEMPGRDEHGS